MIVGKHRCSLELQFSAGATVRLFATASHPANDIMSAQAESLRSSLKELEGLLYTYSPMMGALTERFVGKVIQYGAVFAEVSSPIGKAARH